MLNRVILIGRTTRDVDFRRTSNGTPVASFTLALDNRFVLKDGKPSTDFISCVAWSNTAETMEKYVRKGALIAIEGRIQTRNYDNKDGNRVYITEVVVENMRMLESRGERSSSSNLDGYEPASSSRESYEEVMSPEIEYDISDDDLPF
jgi:single-strand DNA-binding protein